MEPLIVFIWLGLVAGTPVTFLVACFVAYRRNVSANRIIAGLPLTVIIHFVIAYATLFPMFIVLYAGAHTVPVGQVLSWPARLIILGLELTYAILVFSICTYLSGRPRPWPLKPALP